MLSGSGGRLVAESNALEVRDLESHYKDFQALWKVSLAVELGSVVSIIGSNGAGKSTLLNSIAGLMAPTNGNIKFFGEDIAGLAAHKVLEKGISLVPEGRRVFSRLTVYENLLMGSYTPRARPSRNDGLNKLYELFPVLKDRSSQMASTLSGGEQQMLAIARALMSEPKIILCDEISLGLAPLIIKDIYRRLKLINEAGLTIVLVEQDITRSLKAARHAYVMLEGKVVLDGDPSNLSEEDVKKAYFGI
jgi:branched-chain amino acid transport system ATP-binding protein